MKQILLSLLLVGFSSAAFCQSSFYKERYRPRFHFTPPIDWMNDPNGLVYHHGEYHLFYQFNPMGNRWGHMSWGHAVSRDLLYWEHLSVALAEEKDTMIFSGSCVVDQQNSSGFATAPGQVPMVAIYTGHIEGKNQSQHIAYSLDDGRTWKKYDHNPVLDLGKKDFRDPKVFWYAPEKKWIMAVVLPLEKQVQLYASHNLKGWQLMSEFGPAGDTTGIWECPDLFQVPVAGEPGKYKWVLMHSPAPYMQYFVGEFDGTRFVNENKTEKIYRPDYGPDYYAAITYNNLPAGAAPISIGWVNNWDYANAIPTTPWKSMMSLPRNLSVRKKNGEWVLLQQPVTAVQQLRTHQRSWKNIRTKSEYTLPVQSQVCELSLSMLIPAETVSGIRLAAGAGHYFEIGYDAAQKILYIDRSGAGDTSFHPAFAALSRYQTPLQPVNGKINLHIFFDKSIIEVFANDGEAVMTAQLFPEEKNNGITLFSKGGAVLFPGIDYWEIKPIW